MSTPESSATPQPSEADIAATMDVGDGKQIIAYYLNPLIKMPIVRAPQERLWMEETQLRFAYRCLPLLIANQHGWLILNDQKCKAIWRGGVEPDSTRVKYVRSASAPFTCSSHFGHGIITFNIPYLFRTPPGYNLIVRGPTNSPKDGIYPLDGIVETDWNPATFTMNWIFTRSDYPVIFEQGEPICMITPVKRGQIETFDPEIRDVDTAPDIKRDYETWASGRMHFNQMLNVQGSEEQRIMWQKNYFQGVWDGRRADGHQTRLNLKEFKDNTSET